MYFKLVNGANWVLPVVQNCIESKFKNSLTLSAVLFRYSEFKGTFLATVSTKGLISWFSVCLRYSEFSLSTK